MSVYYQVNQFDALSLTSFSFYSCSSNLTAISPPSSFSLFGSNDFSMDPSQITDWSPIVQNHPLAFLSNVATISFPNSSPYHSYMFLFTLSSPSSSLCLSTIKGFSSQSFTTVPYYPIYSITTLTGIAGIQFYTIHPTIPNRYTHFQSLPLLPTGLSLNPQNGTLSGSPLYCASHNYTIYFKDQTTNYYYYTTIYLDMTVCTSSTHILLYLRKNNNKHTKSEYYRLYSSTHELLYQSPVFTELSPASVDHYLCVPIQSKIYIEIGTGDYISYPTTDTTSYTSSLTSFDSVSLNPLSIYYHDLYGVDILLYQIPFSHLTVPTVTYPVLFDWMIPPLSSNWVYSQTTTAENWYTLSQLATFQPFLPTFLTSSSSPLWYFKHHFYLHYNEDISGYLFSFQAYHSFRVYINDQFYYEQSEELLDRHAPQYYTLTIKRNRFHVGQNWISILLNNTNCALHAIQFDGFLFPLTKQIPLSRDLISSITLQSEATPFSLVYLFDHNRYTNWILEDLQSDYISIHFDFSSNHIEVIDYICFISSSLLTSYDPHSFELYGISSSPLLLYSSTIEFFTRRQQNCFMIPSDQLFSSYQLVLHKNPASTALSLSSLSLHLFDNTDQIPTQLLYTMTEVTAYVDYPFPDLGPINNFLSYTIMPSLPESLFFNTTSGSISGIPTEPMTEHKYIIMAFGAHNRTSTLSITIEIVECFHYLIDFMVTNTAFHPNFGFQFNNNNTNENLYSILFISNHHFEHHYYVCDSSGLFNIQFYRYSNQNWKSLQLSIHVNSVPIFLYSMNEYELIYSYTFSIDYLINSLSIWKFYSNSLNENWTDQSYDDSSWTTLLLSKLVDYPYPSTYYLRKTFYIDSITKRPAMHFVLSTNVNYELYINGQFIYVLDSFQETTEEQYIIHQSFSLPYNLFTLGNNILALKITGPATLFNDIHIACTLHMIPSHSIIHFPIYAYDSYSTIPMVQQYMDGFYYSTNTSVLFDHSQSTIYYHPYACKNTIIYIEYYHSSTSYINAYSIQAGPNCNRRHPSSWSFQGYNVQTQQWITLHFVDKQIFTYYNEIKYYRFYNIHSYSNYRFIFHECKNYPLRGMEGMKEQHCEYQNNKGFQLNEIRFYTQLLTSICMENDDFHGGLQHEYVYKHCPLYYDGIIQSYCQDSQYINIKNYCTPSKPSTIQYASSTLVLSTFRSLSFRPTIDAVQYHCSIYPSLPCGLSFHSESGEISGFLWMIHPEQSYTILCSNEAGSANTILTLTYDPAGNVPLYGIVILVVLLCFLSIPCICTFFRQRQRYARRPYSYDGTGIEMPEYHRSKLKYVPKLYKQIPS